MSRAVVNWCGSGKPDALRKVVSFIPRRSAARFIIVANLASVPPTASASTTAASLADSVTSARIACFTDMLSPVRSPSRVAA